LGAWFSRLLTFLKIIDDCRLPESWVKDAGLQGMISITLGLSNDVQIVHFLVQFSDMMIIRTRHLNRKITGSIQWREECPRFELGRMNGKGIHHENGWNEGSQG
jgi:hypothetical protein